MAQELAPLARLDAELEEAISQARTGESAAAPLRLLHSCRHPARSGSWRPGLAALRLPPGWCSPPGGPAPPPGCHRPSLRRRACVAPVLAAYLERLQPSWGRMPAAGDAVERGIDRPGNALAPQEQRSSPAPPVAWWPPSDWRAGPRADRPSFDMEAATSTDVFHASRRAGKWKMDVAYGVCRGSGWSGWRRRKIAGLRLQAITTARSTRGRPGVASRLHFDGQRLQVGPRPRPEADPQAQACLYRRQAGRSHHRANRCLLGRLQPAAFPAVFGPGGDQGPDPELVSQLFEDWRAGRPGERERASTA